MEHRYNSSASLLESLAGASMEALRSGPGEVRNGWTHYSRWLTTPFLLSAFGLASMFLAARIDSHATRVVLTIAAAVWTFLLLLRFLLRGVFLIIPAHYLYNTSDAARFFIELPVRGFGAILVFAVVMLKWPGEYTLHAYIFGVGLLSFCLALVDSQSLQSLRTITNLAVVLTIGYLLFQSNAIPRSVQNIIGNTIANVSSKIPNQLPVVTIRDMAAGSAPRINHENGKTILFYAEYLSSPCGYDFYREKLHHPITGEITKPVTLDIYVSAITCFRKLSSSRKTSVNMPATVDVARSVGYRAKQANTSQPAMSVTTSGLDEIRKALRARSSPSKNQRGLYVVLKGSELDRARTERLISEFYNDSIGLGAVPVSPVFSADLSSIAKKLLVGDPGTDLQRSGVLSGLDDLLVLEIDLSCALDEIYKRFQLCRIDGKAFLHSNTASRRVDDIVLAVIGANEQEAIEDSLRELVRSVTL